jgi:hypothetical protein
MAPLRHLIRHCRWRKSIKPLESKIRQLSLEINQSCSNRLRVQIIPQLTTSTFLAFQRHRLVCSETYIFLDSDLEAIFYIEHLNPDSNILYTDLLASRQTLPAKISFSWPLSLVLSLDFTANKKSA